MPKDEQLVELVDLEVSRVDGVKGPATGMGFLVMKSLEDPTVSELVAKALDETDPSGAADALLQTEVVKASATLVGADNGVAAHGEGEARTQADERAALAMANGTQAELEAELQADELAGVAEISKSEEIPPIPVVESAQLAAATAMGAGTPEWEQQDAANLRRCVALLIELKARLQAGAEREWAEFVADVEPDTEDYWQLNEVVWAIDAALGVVAKITVEEEAEATAMAPDADVMKSAALVIKALTRIGLPVAATTTLKESGVTETAVTKAADAATTTATTEGADVTKQEHVGVYTTPGGGGKDGGPEGEDSFRSAAAEGGKDMGGEKDDSFQTTEEAKAGASGEWHDPRVIKSSTTTEKDPSAGQVDVAAEIAKALSGDALGTVLKSAVEGALQAKLEPVVKTIEGLTERIATVEKQPMPGGPLLRGAAGRPGQEWLVVKGQEAQPDMAAQPLDAEQVRKALEAITDPSERDQVGRALAKSQHPALGL